MQRAGRPDAAGGAATSASTSRAHTTSTHNAAEPRQVEELYATLAEYCRLEDKFQPRLALSDDNETTEVSWGARDGAAHVLRCLKMWFDLPAEALLHAISLFDRFLTKMKVRPCHVPCITVSCMNVAIDELARQTAQPRLVSLEELVKISSSSCTVRDVARMSAIVVDKLALAHGASLTALHWLRALHALVHAAARHLDVPAAIYYTPESALVNLLEIVACSHECANARAPEIALVLIYHKLESQLVEYSRGVEAAGGGAGGVVPEQAYRLFDFAAELQAVCNMSDGSLSATGAQVRHALSRYESRAAAPQRQRLVWRLSERTLKVLRPTDRLTSLLPTIEEQQLSPPRHRSGSESSMSEEISDWPRSPVLPVYCDH